MTEKKAEVREVEEMRGQIVGYVREMRQESQVKLCEIRGNKKRGSRNSNGNKGRKVGEMRREEVWQVKERKVEEAREN